MLFRRLTPDNQLRLHVGQAREYWRLDRLDLAVRAMELALKAGVPPGPMYDLQRTMESEMGARASGQRIRVAEHLTIEADPARWGGYWPVIASEAARALETVESTLDVRWSRPVLLTLIPEDDWVAFMHARFGYYTARTESHKVCLPPCAVRSQNQFRRAARHEMTHAAVHQLAGDDVPRWLNEGLAVLMEGGHESSHAGRRMRLDEISAGFESWEVELGSPRSHRSYSQAAEFTARLLQTTGWEGIRRVLVAVRDGAGIERAVARETGKRLKELERDWLAGAG
jgi:hypothetical protein